MPSTLLSFDLFKKNPLLIVISGTSGVGKDAVIKGLQRRNLNLHYVITATSRPPRADEVDGRDYFFYPPEEFEERIRRDEFIEHALVYQDYKGIPRWQVEGALRSGKDVVIKVDVQGAATLRKLYPQAVLIFVTPLTVDEWLGRLQKRGTESGEDLRVRIETAIREVEQIDMFDYFVANADDLLERAVDDIVTIIAAEHQRIHHRKIL